MSVFVIPTTPITNTITALAGGAQVGATQLSRGFNEIDVVVTANDSVMLPNAILGAECVVNNMQPTTVTVKIYGRPANELNGNLPDTIVAHGATAVTLGSTGVTLGTGHVSWFACMTQGQWKQIADFA